MKTRGGEGRGAEPLGRDGSMVLDLTPSFPHGAMAPVQERKGICSMLALSCLYRSVEWMLAQAVGVSCALRSVHTGSLGQ